MSATRRELRGLVETLPYIFVRDENDELFHLVMISIDEDGSRSL